MGSDAATGISNYLLMHDTAISLNHGATGDTEVHGVSLCLHDLYVCFLIDQLSPVQIRLRVLWYPTKIRTLLGRCQEVTKATKNHKEHKGSTLVLPCHYDSVVLKKSR
jgi:hypothetical protein